MVGFAKGKMGEYTEAEADVQRSLSALREIGDIWNTSPALMVAAAVGVIVGDFGKAHEYLNQGLGIARQLPAIRFIVFHLFGFGLLHRELEDYPSASRADTEAAGLAEQVPRGTWLPVVLGSLAVDAALLGNEEEARARLAQARKSLESMEGTGDFPQEVAYAEARVALAGGRPTEAVQAARRLVDIAEATGTIRHWRVPALLVQAEAALALGDAPSAVAAYHAAAEEAERVGRRPALWRAHAGLADAYRALGQSDAAAASAQRARDIIDRLAATIPDERLRAAFLQSAKVQRVTALAGV
jgi:tetratricopeptide (TPR) repeat protein